MYTGAPGRSSVQYRLLRALEDMTVILYRNLEWLQDARVHCIGGRKEDVLITSLARVRCKLACMMPLNPLKSAVISLT